MNSLDPSLVENEWLEVRGNEELSQKINYKIVTNKIIASYIFYGIGYQTHLKVHGFGDPYLVYDKS